MDDLFRFLVLRNALPARDLSVDLGEGVGESRLLITLGAAQKGADPAQGMRAAAWKFTQSKSFVRDVAELSVADALAAMGAALDADHDADPTKLAAVLEKAFGQDPASVVGSDSFDKAWGRLRDSLVAVKLAPEAAAPTLPALVAATRLMALARRAVRGDPALAAPGAIASARTAPLVLPAAAIVPARLPPATGAAPPAGTPARPADARREADEVAHLRQAIEAVRAFTPDPEMVRAVVRAAARTTADTFQTVRPIERHLPHELDTTPAQLPSAFTTALPRAARTALGIRDGQVQALTAAQAEIKLLGTYKLALADAVAKLTIQGVRDLTPYFPLLHLDPLTVPGEHDDATDPAPATMADVPKTHGSITPAGIGDLLVARQHTVRYEPGEMAHVENVAKGESLVRETRRLDTTETTLVQETESIRDDQRDLQTTGRFDLQQEAGQVVKNDQSRIPGQPSSESYGSLVESAGSKTSSTKQAESYSREIMSRSASQITQRVRTQATTRTLRELEEKATHTFPSTAAAEITVYQWIDRVVQAQVFNYGKRLFYDIVLPEPAAFMARALESRPRELPLPPKPAPFTLRPTLLNEWNWDYYAAGYGASGVTPPPPDTITVARTFSGIAQNAFSDADELRFAMMASGIELAIPDGYRAATVRARVRFSGWFGYLDLMVGTAAKRFVFNTDWYFESPLNRETGTIPVNVLVPEGQAQFTLAIEVICEITEERMGRWQAGAHAAILAAAHDRLAAYEQQLMNLRAALRLLTTGTSAERKQKMVRQEIEKACLEVMTGQHFDGLSAIAHSPQGFPQPYLPNIDLYGRYLRFLEHAFEWPQMTWRYAPYFWGRKPYWVQAVLRDDPDPAFADFLQAGAARALVPVRPGFEASVLAFMADGTVPALDALAEITSPLYVPILLELSEADTALDQGKPYGQAWEVRLPTTLVALRRDGTFPRWKQQVAANGGTTWVAIAGDAIP